ncbi:oligosaccharide flippase family protein [Lacticaseibacillus sharpeae]|uniref:oligosaccharide flippase family protein n=1 Tax=Lacticaseibacillus sharpeae TaxID=1626 RepID=UPI0006D00604|nr:oligosaccharide flippase family protein [Lacticaseibacillus sharpeae]
MKNKVVINTIALYGMNFAKILFPLATLPYLTRVLSLDGYGLVVYVKAIMQYFQLFIDFGFILSGTRDIVIAKKNRANINYVVSRVFFANLILVTIAAVALAIIVETSEMLRTNALFVVLSFVNIALTILLFDYIFRGFEKMHVLTSRFVLMKVISTLLTFIFIKSDADILLIPIIDILGSLVAIFFVILQLKKLQIKIIAVPIKKAIQSLKDSAVFFVSNMATAAFTALDTVVIGAVLSTKDVATGVCVRKSAEAYRLFTHQLSMAFIPT